MRQMKFVFLLVTASALLLAGCKKDGAAGAGGPPGGMAMPPPQVGTVTLQPRDVEQTDDLPGRTNAYQVAEIRPQVSGIILKRLFEEGAKVTEGQQLYQIDPALYQAAYDTARATLEKAQANIATLKVKADRYKDLVALKAVSQQDYDDAVASYKSAQADIDSAQAALKQAEINLAYTKVMSPITGRIGKSAVTPGALVTSNQTTALAVVTQLDPIYVDVTQSSADLMHLKQRIADGQLTTGPQDTLVDLILPDINQKYPFAGKLQFSDITVDPTTGSVDVRAQFPNPDDTLLPGLFVRAIIHEGTHANALMVPQQAVNRDATGQASVMTVDASNKVVPAKIQTGDAIGDQWTVAGGLQAGQQVIVQGWQKVQPGMTVKPVPIDDSGTATAGQNSGGGNAPAAMPPPPAADAGAPAVTEPPAAKDGAASLTQPAAKSPVQALTVANPQSGQSR